MLPREDGSVDLRLQQSLAGSIGIGVIDRDLRFVELDTTLAAFDGMSVTDAVGLLVWDVMPTLASELVPLLRQVFATGAPVIDAELCSASYAQTGVWHWLARIFPVRSRSGTVLALDVVVCQLADPVQADTMAAGASEKTTMDGRRWSMQTSTNAWDAQRDGYPDGVAKVVVSAYETFVEAERDARRTAERAFTRLERLQIVTASLSQALTPEQVARVIVEQGCVMLDARAGTIGLLVENGAILETVGEMGHTAAEMMSWRRIPLTLVTPVTDAVRSGTPVLLGSLEAWCAAYPHLAASAIETIDRAWAAIPLLAEGGVLGSIALSFREARDFDADEQAWMVTLAHQCAQALERARLYTAEQRARLEAEAAVRLRDELVALVSHDLKNPLAAILGQAQLAQRRLAATPPALDRVGKALAAIDLVAERMSMQLEDLLDLARLRSGAALELQRSPVNLVALVQQLAAESQQTTERHQIEVSTTVPALNGLFDSMRLERMIRNLLDNAIKYSPDGGTIKLTLAQERDSGARAAILRVRDNGIGIPAAELAHVFERFHRASNVTGRIAGSGLGLASARQIVELHGGTITVASKVGKNTTFTVRLPLLEAVKR